MATRTGWCASGSLSAGEHAGLANLLGSLGQLTGGPGLEEHTRITSRDPRDWVTGYFTTSGYQVSVYPPQHLGPGNFDLRVRFPSCITHSARVTLTRATTLRLVSLARVDLPATAHVLTGRGSFPANTPMFLGISPDLSPSTIPGFLGLGIGRGFTTLAVFGPVLTHPHSGFIDWKGPVPLSARGTTLYFQGVAADPNTGKLWTTNVGSSSFQ